MSLTDIILKKEELTNDEIELLAVAVGKHPYFHAASLALTSALYKTRSAEYGNTLRRTAISIPDRTALFAIIEGEDYQLGTTRKQNRHIVDDNDNGDRTTALINHFLGSLPEDKPRRVTVADAATDYMSYLQMTEQANTDEVSKQPMRGQTLIDDFIGSNAQGERIILTERHENNTENSDEHTLKQSEDQELETVTTNDEETLPPEYFTETMARIYIKQGKFDKAIKIITRLNTKYPKKNRYFADQMRFLNKLLLNQSKKNE